MKTRVLIIDDEPIAVRVIENYLQHLEAIELVGKYHSAVEAYAILQQKKVDLLFLDINMPQLNGLDFLKSLAHPPKAILTTAYREYALEGFELNVVDYLMKPIPFDRFMKAINKYYELSRPAIQVLGGEAGAAQPAFQEQPHIYIKADRKTLKIYLADILYIEGLKDYVKVHTTSKVVISRQTMTQLEEALHQNHFLRIHRSYIVSVQHIQAITAESIEVAGIELTIGRSYRQAVFSALGFKGGSA